MVQFCLRATIKRIVDTIAAIAQIAAIAVLELSQHVTQVYMIVTQYCERNVHCTHLLFINI